VNSNPSGAWVAPLRVLYCYVAVGMTFAIGACGFDASLRHGRLGTVPADSVVLPRTLKPAELQMLWTRGGTESDTSLLNPFRMAADESHVYVLDRTNARVTAFRGADGTVAWTTGRRGAGPGEFDQPQGIVVGASGDILVLDPANLRIAVLDRGGARVRETRLDDPLAYHACELGDGSLLVSRRGFASPIFQVRGDGSPVRDVELPWPALARANPLQVQGEFATSIGEAVCVFALSLGWGFARFDGPDPAYGARYVESHPLPEIELTSSGRDVPPSTRLVGPPRFGALGAAISGDTLSVAFGGHGADRARIIDQYDVASGAYLYSIRTPVGFDRVARHGDRFFFLGITDEGYPVLQSARLVR
jgi:hypothetical protein